MERLYYVMKNARIEISNLVVRYRQYETASRSIKLNLLTRKGFGSAIRFALNGIDLSVNPGEVLGIIGRNGAGKSTLAKAIVGSVRPYSGWVRTAGVMTSMIELGAGLNHDLSARDNVKLHSEIFKFHTTLPSNRAEKVCEWAGLSNVIDQPLRTYSSGMLARFAFSLNTDINPDILVLDEILSVGDIDFQDKSFERTMELMNAGTTVVLISHDMNAIKKFCDRALWLEEGRTKIDGNPDFVVGEYLSHNNKN